ncbi:MAG TPA: YHYH protein [Alphaproteobacteria bacterium]|nr:YHYH protein [Alphaproteobacteria bacterium]
MEITKTVLLCGGLLLAGMLAPAALAQTQSAGPDYLSDHALLALASNAYANGTLPLGDGHYTLNQPRKGYIDLCREFGRGRGGAQHAGGWIHGDTWNPYQKLAVQGHVAWPDARFSITRDDDKRVLAGNGLPVGATTGIFPIRPNDPAFAFDRNPNRIEAHQFRETLPADPAYSTQPYCMGMEAGIMTNGVLLFNGFNADLRDAAAHEVQDSCRGHPQSRGIYHYHSLSSCLRDIGEKTVIGYALDGFPITGPEVAPGKYLVTADLDECHGITSAIIEDGRKAVTYHYVMTMDFPYSVSCFRAKPMRIGPAQDETENFGNRGGDGAIPASAMGGRYNRMGPRRAPPQALDACGGQSDGAACSFITQRGDQISGTCRMLRQQNAEVCVPTGGPP